MIFDLNAAPDVAFEAVKLAAQDLRQSLQQKGVESVLKCTGAKGLHVTVPLAGKDKCAAVKSFAVALAEEMVAAAPEAYVAIMSKRSAQADSLLITSTTTIQPRRSPTTEFVRGPGQRWRCLLIGKN